MFTVDEVNQEIKNYIKYTSYVIPIIQDVIYVDTSEWYGEVNSQEILEGKYIIRFSNNLNNCPIEFQKSVIWHETTHIVDIINNKDLDKSMLSGMMSTYSEAHAESIQLRYLLHITPKQIVNNGKRFLCHVDGREDLGAVTANYINSSYQHLINFKKSKSPKDFQKFINGFSYFCGYMMLKTTKDANILSGAIIEKYPKSYQKDLSDLYTYITTKNFLGCAAIYAKLKAEAMMESFNSICCINNII